MSIKVRVAAPLDPAFQPAVLSNRNYVNLTKTSGQAVPLVLALEREGGFISRFETVIRPATDPETLRYVERIVKFLVWARGGWKLYLGGPKLVGDAIARCYSKLGERAFDVELMSRIYERPFEVVATDAKSVPARKELEATLGGHLDGCRIGFDLGASDYKIAAVKEGQVLYTDEFPWNPKDQADPQYHYDHINDAIKKAAAYLPRVDAIGGSSAGVIVNNQIMVASLFRAIPQARFAEAKTIFLRLGQAWGVPMEVANDGDVTALAGAMSLKVNGLLGVAMGSSEAAGYLNPNGCMTGWLSELAFAPVDDNQEAPADEWSEDRGVGALYFSQQAINKLLASAGIKLPPELGLPERLKEVQNLMSNDDPRARKIYETIGVYLGYTIPHYADFYSFNHMLILGRVTTGCGGNIVLAKAREVLQAEFPAFAENVTLYVPDEKTRRIGQAVAAASLPEIRK